MTVHGDVRLFMDFRGLKDGLTGLRRAVDGEPEEADVTQSLDRVRGVGAYQFDFRLNASVSYEPVKNLSFQVFGQNLLGANRNKRYCYDFTGNVRASPHRVRFIEELPTFGIRLDCRF